ncbi:MAG: hypothetical protein KAU14_07815 [Thermoplasmata archaeon]|nr:hypothetical protein [Thermoplasmata archaeon]
MGLRDIEIDCGYDSDEDDVLDEFYIPVLRESKTYRRITGYFSSSAFAYAARGIKGLIDNGGKIELISGFVLSRKDREAIDEGYKSLENIIEEKYNENFMEFQNDTEKAHVRALAWLIANKRLDFKIAVLDESVEDNADFEKIVNQGIFHQKVGIFEDGEGDKVSFSGSINETAMGWAG